MIVGIGTDLCDTTRLAQALARHGERFAAKVLGVHELVEYQKRQAAAPARALKYLGTRFAAKEALSKAIGLGMREPMSWHACEILNDAMGRPELVLNGDLLVWLNDRHWHAHVSVSDEGAFAQAFVIVETRNSP